jgi:hypothetical protein
MCGQTSSVTATSPQVTAAKRTAVEQRFRSTDLDQRRDEAECGGDRVLGREAILDRNGSHASRATCLGRHARWLRIEPEQ